MREVLENQKDKVAENLLANNGNLIIITFVHLLPFNKYLMKVEFYDLLFII